jgi:hypothetical protein
MEDRYFGRLDVITRRPTVRQRRASDASTFAGGSDAELSIASAFSSSAQSDDCSHRHYAVASFKMASEPRTRAVRTGVSVDLADIPPDLHSRILDAIEATADVRDAQAEHAYRVALLARSAIGRGRVFVSCARALGMQRQTLQPFALVATRWSPEDLRSLFSARDAHGRPLSISHLQLLARLPRGERNEWLVAVLRDCIDVHSLRERLRRNCHQEEQRGDEEPAESLTRLRVRHSSPTTGEE